MSGATIARRVVLRLDPRPARDGASVVAATRFARAFHAELAARLVSDTRFAAALTAPAGSAKPRGGDSFSPAVLVRRSETIYRRAISAIAEREQTAWSFSVVECDGVLSDCGAIQSDDLVALDLEPLEGAAGALRREVHSALSFARGVLLFPSEAPPHAGPVVVVTKNNGRNLTDLAKRIAAALDEPLLPLQPSDRMRGVAEVAAAIRQRTPGLAVIDASDPLAQEFVTRPRFLRELNAPLLLLKI